MTPKVPLKEQEIRMRMQVVCICKGIKAGKIIDAIRIKQCSTVESVNKATGSGSGGCNATRCGPVIAAMVSNGGELPQSSVPQEPEDDLFLP